jgi:hypothetical protein
MVVSQAAKVFTATPGEFGALMARDIVRLGKMVGNRARRGVRKGISCQEVTPHFSSWRSIREK